MIRRTICVAAFIAAAGSAFVRLAANTRSASGVEFDMRFDDGTVGQGDLRGVMIALAAK